MITFRAANLDDVPLLSYWDTKPHVISAIGDEAGYDWTQVLAEADEYTEHRIALDDGRPVGIVTIVDPELEHTHYWGDAEPNMRAIDIWIGEESDLGRGLGTQMMKLTLAHCFADPAVTAVLIDPLANNLDARRFYERIGFAQVGPRRFGTDDCVVYRFDRPSDVP